MSRRILVTADDPVRKQLCQLLKEKSWATWVIVEANSVEQARFVQQLNPCDIVLVDSTVVESDKPIDLRGLARSPRVPLLLLSDVGPGTTASSSWCGASHCISRQLALADPNFLANMLRQVTREANFRRRLRRSREALTRCRGMVNRLVALIWQTVTFDAQKAWLNQGQILKRLHEEIERSRRHAIPLSVILAEMDEGHRGGDLFQRLASLVNQCKRSGDVAGQYGSNGFLLLLPHASSDGAVTWCRRLGALLEDTPAGEFSTSETRLWFGIASFAAPTSSVQGLLATAEKKLEEARHNRPEERLAY